MSGAAEGERWAVKKGVERYNGAAARPSLSTLLAEHG